MKIRPLYIVIAVVVLLGAWMMTGYNGFISSQQSVKTAWAQVETTYQRRFDLIPNVVSTVQGSADFEQGTLTAVTQARTQWQQAGSVSGKVAAAEQFDSALSRLLVTVEAYPTLQSTQAFRDLITELEGTENRIAVARRDYNTAVQEYNVRVMRFPARILAGLFGFSAETMFEATPGAEVAPKVNFGSAASQAFSS
ncbi:MAG: LemA family protein [Candidatus Peribacteraceae bacterium]